MNRRAFLLQAGCITGYSCLSGCLGSADETTGENRSRGEIVTTGSETIDEDYFNIRIRNHAKSVSTVSIVVSDSDAEIFTKQVEIGTLPNGGDLTINDAVTTPGEYHLQATNSVGKTADFDWEVGKEERNAYVGVSSDAEMSIGYTPRM